MHKLRHDINISFNKITFIIAVTRNRIYENDREKKLEVIWSYG